jgi:hypothetical protein
MTITDEDIGFATRICAGFQPLYQGPNPLAAGSGIEDKAEQQAAVAAAWDAWSAFSKSYFMAMLNTLSGCKPIALESEITRFCTPAEALGGRAAMDVFWRRELCLRGQVERRGAYAFTPIQRAIFADDTVNQQVFRAVERQIESSITHILRARRGFLQEINPDTDHAAGLQEDMATFFAGGRPAPLSLKQRDENFDGVLLTP